MAASNHQRHLAPLMRLGTRLMLLAAGGLLLGACQGAATARCRSGAELRSDLTPVHLSLDASQCARRGNWGEGSLLFGVAKAFSLYDAMREERTGGALRQGWPGPKLPALIIREGLDQAQVRRLQEEIRTMTHEPGRHRQLCSLLRRLGPPTYPGDYRVNERWQVSFPPQPAKSQAAPPSTVTWEQVLTRQVECPPRA